MQFWRNSHAWNLMQKMNRIYDLGSAYLWESHGLCGCPLSLHILLCNQPKPFPTAHTSIKAQGKLSLCNSFHFIMCGQLGNCRGMRSYIMEREGNTAALVTVLYYGKLKKSGRVLKTRQNNWIPHSLGGENLWGSWGNKLWHNSSFTFFLELTVALPFLMTLLKHLQGKSCIASICGRVKMNIHWPP